MANYKKLIVWQKSDELAFQVYLLTEQFPKKEMFGITSQIRRATLSVPTNIVEGFSRKTKKDFSHFLDISLGSLAETEYLLEFSKRFGYVKSEIKDLEALLDETGKLLWSFQKSL